MFPYKYIAGFLLAVTSAVLMQAEAQEIYAARYNAVITSPPRKVPTSKTPDGALAGNGDIGLTLGGSPERLTFYIGKNDFWRAYPVYPGGGIAHPGGITVSIDALKNASWRAEQVMDKAAIKAKFENEKLELTVNAWVAATRNIVFIELEALKTDSISFATKLWSAKGNTSVSDSGFANAINWVTRSFENTPLLEWPCHIAMAKKSMISRFKMTLAISVYTSFDRPDYKNAAISEVASLTIDSVKKIKEEHENWWKQFWSRSQVQIGDSLLEKYYYASQYLLACTSRKGKFSPGIWGCFITQDSTAWGGDYHLNYNYQAPYWAAFSSNYIDLTDNFDQPLLDYMDKGKMHAKTLLQTRGIYFPVGIGPKALVTTRWPLTPDEMEQRYGSRENSIDSGYKFLGQKINAVFSVGNMLMRFYSTYDESYLRRIYPYLLACADFWEDYLKFENGRYVIYMDHFNEVMPNLRNRGIWRNRLGDFNSTLSLGLVKMLFRGMIDASRFLQQDTGRISKWQHIVTHLSAFPLGENNGRISLKNMEKGPQNTEVRASGLNRVAIHGLILPAGVVGPYSDASLNKILLSDVEHWKDRVRAKGEWGNTLGNGIETCFPGAIRVGYHADSVMHYLKERLLVQPHPNLYIVQGGGGIETLAAVPLTVNEMLLQSYEHMVRVFPNWNKKHDASFTTLRAYGAFLISSDLRGGEVQFVKLLSEKGRSCKMENPWPGAPVQLFRNGKSSEILRGDILNFSTQINETIELKKA